VADEGAMMKAGSIKEIKKEPLIEVPMMTLNPNDTFPYVSEDDQHHRRLISQHSIAISALNLDSPP